MPGSLLPADPPSPPCQQFWDMLSTCVPGQVLASGSNILKMLKDWGHQFGEAAIGCEPLPTGLAEMPSPRPPQMPWERV